MILRNDIGLTLVELLAALAIFGIISTIIISVLISGMNSYERVNNEILLHDEANYVMTQFVNLIYAASNVVVLESSEDECESLIQVTNLSGERLVPTKTILGFKDHNAVIGENVIQSSDYYFTCDAPGKSTMTVKGNTVLIDMFIQEKGTGERRTFELKNEISFEKIN